MDSINSHQLIRCLGRPAPAGVPDTEQRGTGAGRVLDTGVLPCLDAGGDSRILNSDTHTHTQRPVSMLVGYCSAGYWCRTGARAGRLRDVNQDTGVQDTGASSATLNPFPPDWCAAY
jgi:hypothetical protein